MPYIGPTPIPKASLTRQNIIKTEPFTTLNVAGGYIRGNIDVYVNGVYIHPQNYTAQDGLTITFDSEFFAGTGDDAVEIEIRQLQSFKLPAEDNVYSKFEYTDIAGETVISLVYDVGLVQVLYNGVQLTNNDFTALDGTAITLAEPVERAEDVITVIRWGKTSSNFPIGTAGEKDAVISPTDTTPDRVLLTGAGKEQLDPDLYHKGNILGTVSQSGGEVTGAIFERGGGTGTDFEYEYSKYVDGTFEVWGKFKAAYHSATTLRGSMGLPFNATTNHPFGYSLVPDLIGKISSSGSDIDVSNYNEMQLGARNNGGAPTSRTRIGAQIGNEAGQFVTGNYIWVSFIYKARWY